MKAMYVVGEKNQEKPTVDAEQCEITSPRKRSRLLIGAVSGVIGVLFVSGMVLAAFYAGSIMHRNAYKTAWATFINTDDPRQSVTEKIVVTDTEADVIRPGVIRVILDTENGYLTFLQDTPVTDGELNPCYIADVDVTGHTSIVKSNILQEHVRQVVPFSANTHEFKLTDEPVDPAILSSRTKEMCFGRDIMKAYETTGADRVRRDGRVRLLWGLIDIEWKKKEK